MKEWNVTYLTWDERFISNDVILASSKEKAEAVACKLSKKINGCRLIDVQPIKESEIIWN